MKKWYLKLGENNVILDAIEYQVEGYVEVELEETHLPVGINGGWFKWNGVTYEEDVTLKPITSSERVTKLEEQNAQIILALVNGGMM